jgi:hypothetical protein
MPAAVHRAAWPAVRCESQQAWEHPGSGSSCSVYGYLMVQACVVLSIVHECLVFEPSTTTVMTSTGCLMLQHDDDGQLSTRIAHAAACYILPFQIQLLISLCLQGAHG